MPTIYLRQHIPLIGSILIFVLGGVTIGADNFSAALLLSTLTLTLGAFCLLYLKDLRPPEIVKYMLIIWGGIFLTAIGFDRLNGVQDEYLMLAACIALFSLGDYIARSRIRLKLAFNVFTFFTLLCAGFAFFQYMLTPEKIFGIQKLHHADRLTGFFISANSAATFFGALSVILQGHLFHLWRKYITHTQSGYIVFFKSFLPKAYIPLITCVMCLSCLILTASRAGIMSTCLIMCLLYFWQSPGLSHKFGNRLILGLIIGLGLAFIWNLSGHLASVRYQSLLINDNARQQMITICWQAFLQKPWWGHGLGYLDVAINPLLMVDNYTTIMRQNAAHNVLIQWLVQMGVLGSGLMFGLYLYILYRIWRTYSHNRYRHYIAAILCMSLLLLIHGQVDYGLEIPLILLIHVWFLGMAYGLNSSYKSRNYG